MELIEKLYNICSEKKTLSTSDIRKKAGSKYQLLRNKLPAELADELDILMNESMKLNLEDMESCFKEGFCRGAELILELKSENIKEMLM